MTPQGRSDAMQDNGFWSRVWRWLPERIDRRVRFLGWLSLVWQILLVATGGAVRLTGSGLGCPTWPKCTDASLVNTPAMGIHGFIEFGNRTLTVMLTLIVIAMFLSVIRMKNTRSDLFWLAFWIGMSIPAQAVVGGITVLVKLNPYVVGFHFLISMVLVAAATVLLVRIYATPGPRVPNVPSWFAVIAWVTAAFAAITVTVGVLTSGSGPHPGDTGTPRNNLDTELMEHLHALPAYILGGLTLLLVGASIGIAVGKTRKYLVILLAVELAQIGVGLLQSNLGLPSLLVGIHLVLASILVAAMTLVLMSMKVPATPAVEPAEQAVRSAEN